MECGVNPHVVSSERSTGLKLSKYKSGSKDASKAAVLDDTIVGRIPLIFSDRNKFY